MIVGLLIILILSFSIIVAYNINRRDHTPANSRVYHYHLTIEHCTADELKNIAYAVKAKPTIDLYTDIHNQTDRMITKYGINYKKLLEQLELDIVKINQLGYNVVRTKVEEVTEELYYDSQAEYSEVHIKVNENSYTEIDGISLSKNSIDGSKFYNARFN